MKKWTIFSLFLFILVFAGGCSPQKEEYGYREFYLDMAFSIVPKVQVVDTITKLEELDDLRNELSEITTRLDNVFSTTKETSYLSLINEQAGVAPVTVPEDVIIVLKEAIAVARESIVDEVALYDVTIYPVWELWNFSAKYYHELEDNRETIPNPQDIINRLPLVDYTKIIIDEVNSTVYLTDENMKIDLGSIVKGFACDLIKTYLLEQGITRATIDVGGNLLTYGANFYNDSDQPWKIKIQTPYVSQYQPNYWDNYFLGTYYDTDVTVVSSGTYERYIKTEEGVDYHHILDPRTGYSFDNGLISVTIITEISMFADAYSTAVFSMGLENGMEFIEGKEELEAVFVTKNKEIYVSSGLEEAFLFNNNIENIGYTYKGVYDGTSNS